MGTPIKPLSTTEKSHIATRLRGGESPADIAWDMRVPELWVRRVAHSLAKLEEQANRQKLKRARVAEIGRRLVRDVPPLFAEPETPSARGRQPAQDEASEKVTSFAHLLRPEALSAAARIRKEV